MEVFVIGFKIKIQIYVKSSLYIQQTTRKVALLNDYNKIRESLNS